MSRTGSAVEEELVAGHLSSGVEGEGVVDVASGVEDDSVGICVGVELCISVGDFRSVVVDGAVRPHHLDVGERQVTCDESVEGIFRGFLVFDFDSFRDVGEQRVADVSTRSVAEEEALLSADSHDGPSGDGWRGEWHFVCRDVSVVGVVSVEFASAVTDSVGLVLDDEPVAVVLTAVSLVPVEAVVACEGHHCVCDGDCSTEEFDAVVKVGDHLDVIECGSASDATEGEAVDFVGSCELRTTVTNGDVAHDARAVAVVGSTVRSAVVVCRDAFDLSDTTEVG